MTQRSAMASPEKDREVANHLRSASREVEQALQVVRACSGYRAKRVERDLGRLLNAMSEVGTMAPKFGGDDPDLLSEEELSLRVRKAREERRQARKQQASTEGEG